MPSSISDYVPQCVTGEEARRRQWVRVMAWGVTASAALLFVAAVCLAPVARARGAGLTALVIYQSFSFICHQMPERSFHLEGHPLAVCARCFGLYAGLAAGVLAYPLVRSLRSAYAAPARGWLIAAALPTSIDFALGYLGIWANTHASRFWTAALLGAVAAFYIVPGALDAGAMARRRFFMKKVGPGASRHDAQRSFASTASGAAGE